MRNSCKIILTFFVVIILAAFISYNATYASKKSSITKQKASTEAQAKTKRPPVQKLITAPKPQARSKKSPVRKHKTAKKQTTIKRIAKIRKHARKSTRGYNGISYGEMLDWWTSVDGIFSRGSKAVVTDLYTGESFNVMRTMGTNHADCEALTRKDTDIIKEIWGGFSWDRRPVIVEVNGRRIAASMSGMPHAGLDSKPAYEEISNRSGDYGSGQNLDVIKDNGMDGHFDIHFLNSTRHKDGKIDPEHQHNVHIAAGR